MRSYGDFYCNGRKRDSRIDILYFSPFVCGVIQKLQSEETNCRMRYFFPHDPRYNEILMEANRYRRNVYESVTIGRVGEKGNLNRFSPEKKLFSFSLNHYRKKQGSSAGNNVKKEIFAFAPREKLNK